jgi:hypothetical protein
MSAIEQQLFSLNDVATRWGINIFTIKRRIKLGDIKAVNIGARQLIHVNEILRVESEGAGKPKRPNPRKTKTTKQASAA